MLMFFVVFTKVYNSMNTVLSWKNETSSTDMKALMGWTLSMDLKAVKQIY